VDPPNVDTPPATADVVVIGGGIVGAATAFFLARSGRRPVIVERMDRLADATTRVSAHAVRCQFSEPENIDQTKESLAIYEGFADLLDRPEAGSAIGLCQQGYLFASTEPDEAPAFRARVERQRSLGVDDVELLDGDEIRHRFPWMSAEVAVGTFRQRDGWLDASAAAVELAAASGAPVFLGTTVVSIDIEAGRVTGVTTDRGRIATGDVVLAAGPLSRSLSPEPLPVALWRRHRIATRADDRVPAGAPMTIDANTGAHWRPHRGGAMVAWALPGSDREATWPVETDPAWPDLALRSETGVGRLSPFWRGLAAELTPADYLFTAGLYTVTPDHKPLIGPANETVGLWLNTGYSGHGVMGAPSGSRLLADLMASRVLAGDNPFHPGRFAAGTKPPDLEQIVL